MDKKEKMNIENYLMSKKINPAIKGFDYLVYAIHLVGKDSTYKHNITKRLYPDIANHFNDTPSRVERAIRHAVGKIKCFKTNSEFIATAEIEIRTNKK